MVDVTTRAGKGSPISATEHDDNLEYIIGHFQSGTAPASPYASQLWADTATSTLKIRNTANTAWITLGTLDDDAVFAPNAAQLDVAQTFAAAQRGSTDTDTTNSGNVTLDFSANQNFVLTLTGNVTLDNPTTEVVGQSGFIVFIQDATGGRTVSLGTDYETAGGAGLTLSSAANATDMVPYVVAASGRILLGTPQLAFA